MRLCYRYSVLSLHLAAERRHSSHEKGSRDYTEGASQVPPAATAVADLLCGAAGN